MPTLLMRSGREIHVLGEYDDVYAQADERTRLYKGSEVDVPDFTEFSERDPAFTESIHGQTIAVRRSQIEGVRR